MPCAIYRAHIVLKVLTSITKARKIIKVIQSERKEGRSKTVLIHRSYDLYKENDQKPTKKKTSGKIKYVYQGPRCKVNI